MKISKKTLSIILFVLAGICVLAAVILLVKGLTDENSFIERKPEKKEKRYHAHYPRVSGRHEGNCRAGNPSDQCDG